ncbi:MAG: DNA polymerase III subunit gamma/tau [Nitrospirae bacterium]|nr:DNA polymerase III subunit gamma/tau [Nitrospirota bacterium]
MSYIVLARKWRPDSFDELVGQKTISTILKNAISQGRIAHAYLFSGPRGVGKTSTARILAKALNCAEGPTPEPCGECEFCRAVAEGHAVDVMEIDGASNNSVEDIRDLRERVKYAPSAGRYKVYIIDEVHMLSQSAFNALLKTLEEPPPHIVFVLATTAAQKIPVTVLSRCQHLAFRRVPFAEMKGHLTHITSEEGIGISGQAVEMIVRAADGSMRDALTLLDQLSAFSQQITDADVRDLLGVTDAGRITEMTEALLRGDRKEIIALVGRLYDSGTDFRSFTRELLQLIRTMLITKITSSSDDASLSDVERDFMARVLPSVTEEELTLLLSEAIKIEAEVRGSFSPRIALEVGLIKASMLSALRPVGDIIKRLHGLRPETVPLQQESSSPDAAGAVGSSSAPPDASASPVPGSVAGAAASSGPVNEDVWQRVLSTIEERNHILASKLKHAEPAVKAGRLVLAFNGGHSIHSDSVQRNLDDLKAVLRDAGDPMLSSVKEIAVVQRSEKRSENGRVSITPEEERVMEVFGGRIIDKRRTDV